MIRLLDEKGTVLCDAAWDATGCIYLCWRRGQFHLAPVPDTDGPALLLLIRRGRTAVLVRLDRQCVLAEATTTAIVFDARHRLQIGLADYLLEHRPEPLPACLARWCQGHRWWWRWVGIAAASGLLWITIRWGLQPIDPVTMALQAAALWMR